MMYFCKKLINSDLLQLAILVSLLRLDLNSYLDGLWNNRLEASDIFLGTNIAYSQTRFNYLHNTINGYIHPKSIDAMLYERSSIFAELNSLGSYSRFQPTQSNVFAYLVDQEDHEVQEPSQNSLPGSSESPAENANAHQDVDSRNDGTTEMRNETNHEPHETPVSASPGSELSYEDMNLIEILWKQDIDLGLTKDAFDFRSSKEVTKPKQTEVLKQQKESPKDAQPQPSVFDPWEGVPYTIDGETGEHIVQQHLINPCLPDVENCTLNDFDLDKLAEELQNVPLDETIRLLNDECTDNQTDDLKKDAEYSNTFDGLDYENLTNSIVLNDCDDSLIEQLRDLDSLLGKDVDDTENQVDGIFSNVEDCWQNITTVLSLASDIPNDQPGMSQPGTAVSNVAAPNDEISSNIPSVNANFSEIFSNSLLQNSTLGSPVLPFNSVTGPSCMSSSQSSAFDPFSNHTDPMSENMMNVTYDHNFTNFFGPENSTNPDFLSNILFDEDLELMDMSHVEDGGAGISTNKVVQDYKDASRDSALSSMDSDRNSSDDEECMDYTSHTALFSERGDFGMCSSSSAASPSPSLSYCSTGSATSSDRSTAPKKYKLFGKKPFHFHDRKNCSEDDDDDKHENHKKHPQNANHFKSEEYNMEEDFGGDFNSSASDKAIDLSEKYKFSKQKDLSVANSINQNFHHNHTYSMPFESDSDSHKPVTRDKNLELEESGRDEKRAQELKIPISTHDIVNLPIDEFNERVSKYDLNEAQLVLIRDIRRRGKNKVAAQNCRKRKIGQIVNLQEDLRALLDEKKTLKAEQEKILSYRRIVADKYNQLYKLIKQSTSSGPPPPRPPDFLRQLTLNERERDLSIPSNSTSLNGSDRNCCSKGARSKRKTDQK